MIPTECITIQSIKGLEKICSNKIQNDKNQKEESKQMNMNIAKGGPAVLDPVGRSKIFNKINGENSICQIYTQCYFVNTSTNSFYLHIK